MKLRSLIAGCLLSTGFTTGFGKLVHAHSSPLPAAATKACEVKARSSACAYLGHHGERYIGTCQLMGPEMLCVRNQPIVWPDTSDPSDTSKSN